MRNKAIKSLVSLTRTNASQRCCYALLIAAFSHTPGIALFRKSRSVFGAAELGVVMDASCLPHWSSQKNYS